MLVIVRGIQISGLQQPQQPLTGCRKLGSRANSWVRPLRKLRLLRYERTANKRFPLFAIRLGVRILRSTPATKHKRLKRERGITRSVSRGARLTTLILPIGFGAQKTPICPRFEFRPVLGTWA